MRVHMRERVWVYVCASECIYVAALECVACHLAQVLSELHSLSTRGKVLNNNFNVESITTSCAPCRGCTERLRLAFKELALGPSRMDAAPLRINFGNSSAIPVDAFEAWVSRHNGSPALQRKLEVTHYTNLGVPLQLEYNNKVLLPGTRWKPLLADEYKQRRHDEALPAGVSNAWALPADLLFKAKLGLNAKGGHPALPWPVKVNASDGLVIDVEESVRLWLQTEQSTSASFNPPKRPPGLPLSKGVGGGSPHVYLNRTTATRLAGVIEEPLGWGVCEFTQSVSESRVKDKAAKAFLKKAVTVRHAVIARPSPSSSPASSAVSMVPYTAKSLTGDAGKAQAFKGAAAVAPPADVAPRAGRGVAFQQPAFEVPKDIDKWKGDVKNAFNSIASVAEDFAYWRHDQRGKLGLPQRKVDKTEVNIVYDALEMEDKELAAAAAAAGTTKAGKKAKGVYFTTTAALGLKEVPDPSGAPQPLRGALLEEEARCRALFGPDNHLAEQFNQAKLDRNKAATQLITVVPSLVSAAIDLNEQKRQLEWSQGRSGSSTSSAPASSPAPPTATAPTSSVSGLPSSATGSTPPPALGDFNTLFLQKVPTVAELTRESRGGDTLAEFLSVVERTRIIEFYKLTNELKNTTFPKLMANALAAKASVTEIYRLLLCRFLSMKSDGVRAIFGGALMDIVVDFEPQEGVERVPKDLELAARDLNTSKAIAKEMWSSFVIEQVPGVRVSMPQLATTGGTRWVVEIAVDRRDEMQHVFVVELCDSASERRVFADMRLITCASL